MTRLTKAAFADELACSEATLARIMKALGKVGRPLDDFDALQVLILSELQNLEIQPHRAVELVLELHAEIRHVAAEKGRTCWLIWAETEERTHRFSALSGRHLDGILASFPLCSVMSLHEVAARASERLDAMKSRLRAAKQEAA